MGLERLRNREALPAGKFVPKLRGLFARVLTGRAGDLRGTALPQWIDGMSDEDGA